MPAIVHQKIGPVDTEKGWDASENVRRLRHKEAQSYYEKMFMWREKNATDQKTDFKFPFHFVDDGGDIGKASLKAAAAIIAVLNGGRGGADIPDADRRDMYEEAVKVYKAAGVEPDKIPELKTNAEPNSLKVNGEGVYITGELRVMQQISEFEYGVEIRIMRDGVNRNKWDFRNLQDYYLQFLGKPILCAYVGQQIGDGHNMREAVDPDTGKKYFTFRDATAERIVGAISGDKADISLVSDGGHTWIVAKGKLWTFYAPELVDKIVRTGRMEISSETLAVESHMDGEIEVITVWKALGVTILGDHVAPAIPGANIAKLAAMDSEFKELKLRAASLEHQEPQNPGEKKQKQLSTQKGVNKIVKNANKKQLLALQPKFPDYNILTASEDLKYVALMSKDGSAATYTFRDEDNGEVVQSMIKPVTLCADISFGENEVLSLSFDEATDAMGAQIATLTQERDAATTKLTAAETSITAMQTAEHARRLEAVKDAVKVKSASLTSLYGPEVTADFAEKIDAEKFAAMESDGKFTGDAEACKELMANCMENKAKLDEAKKLAASNAFVWDNIKSTSQKQDGLMASVARINS